MRTLNELDEFDFHHHLEEQAGLALVVFLTSACGACKRLRTALRQLLESPGAPAVFTVDARSAAALVHEFEVAHLPAMFLYVDGRYHSPLHSAPQPDSLRAAIALAAAQPAREAP